MQPCKAVRWFALRRLTKADPHRPKSVVSPARIVRARWRPWPRGRARLGFHGSSDHARSSPAARGRTDPCCALLEQRQPGLKWEEKKTGEWPEPMTYDLGSKTKS